MAPPAERIASPDAMIAIHRQNVHNDADGSRNRGSVQELMDFVPPFDQKKMEEEGRGDGFNINFGLGASTKNEAQGAFVDIFISPAKLANIPLKASYEDKSRRVYGDIMSEEWTKMVRASDIGLPRFLLLSDVFTTHGIGIMWYEDDRSWRFYITGLDDVKFPKDTQAINSQVPMMTMEKELYLDELWRKIADAPEGEEWYDGWNVPEVKRVLAETAKIRTSGGSMRNFRYENYEHFVTECKTNQLYVQNCLPTVSLIYGWVREYSGKWSHYICVNSKEKERKPYAAKDKKKQWIYKGLSIVDEADRLFNIFPYSVGHKNMIYTTRGLGYFIYEAAQADNVLRNKMMENAKMASSHVYSSDMPDDGLTFEILDYGPVVVLPPGLTPRDQPAAMNLERNMMPVLDSNQAILERHSGGLASSNYFKEPRARENKLATAAFIEETTKLNAFAISLFYNPWDKAVREMVRRSFQVIQTDPVVKNECDRMKQACIDRGVPKEAFDEIDINAVTAFRVLGNGSRAQRLMLFQQGSQLFSSFDPEGQENFVYDHTIELFGAAQGERYKMRPSERTEHIDVKMAQLENHVLMDGGWVDPTSGENPLVHLNEHLEEMEAGLELVKTGQVEYGQWTMSRLPLYKHIVATLEQATVHESLLPQLKEMRRREQNMRGIVENGIKQLEAQAAEADQAASDQAQMGGEGGGQPQAEEQMKEREHAMKLRHEFEMLQAKIAATAETAKAEIAIKKQRAMADMDINTMKAANEMRVREAFGV